ncbi:MAG: helix-turn-helix transcriptional regulator [Clostridia bacterium]|nr:helix-turn-helix transcriptional regulator [Clostridia bacterium]
MKENEVQAEFAEQLRKLRKSHGLSKAKMADLFDIDVRRYGDYESGARSPSAPELVMMYETLGEDILRATLDCVYTDIYKGVEDKDDVHAQRAAAVHFFQHVATDRMVREFNYIAFGSHGSNFEPQLAEFVALDHLPLDYRVAIVKNIITFYRMADARGELVCTDHIAPDFDILVDAIRKGLDAVGEGRNSYSTIIKK